jgi:Alpha/beta hydrolase of unknown function (DUF900)
MFYQFTFAVRCRLNFENLNQNMRTTLKTTGLLLTMLLLVNLVGAQTVVETSSQPVLTDWNADASNLSDMEVELKAIETATPVAASSVPSFGNYYSAQHAPGTSAEWPPLPGNIFGLSVWPVDSNTFLINDLNFNYDSISSATPSTKVQTRAVAMVDSGPPDFSDTNSSGTNYYLPEPMIAAPNYGTNLWIAQWGKSNNVITGIASNTIADVQYEFLTNSDLTTTNWGHTGIFILGSETTNWTALIPTTVVLTNNLFYRLLSWQSSDNSGLPDWWELEYFGHLGVDPNAQDAAGDGYTVYQKFQMGLDPNVFYTPPAPQSSVSYNANNNVATVTWLPAQGPVTNYLVTEVDYQTGVTTNFSVSPTTFSFQDNLTADLGEISPYDVPVLYADYTVEAQYAGGNSSTITTDVGYIPAPTVNLVTGPQGRLFLDIPNLPSDLSELHIYRQQNGWDFSVASDDYGQFYTLSSSIDAYSPLADGYFNIPAVNITNGICQIPDSEAPPFYADSFSVQTVRSNGVASGWATVNSYSQTLASTPFIDARRQLKDNLQFLLRGANGVPVTFQVVGNSFSAPNYTWASNYVYSGFFASGDGELYNYSGVYSFQFSWLRPINDNFLYKNFVFNSSTLSPNGLLDTGCSSDNGYAIGSDETGPFTYYVADPIIITNFPDYYFNWASFVANAATNASATVPSSQLSLANTQWILPPYGGPINFGGGVFSSGQANCYGLSLLSQQFAYVTNSTLVTVASYPGNTIPSSVSGVSYSDYAQPTLAITNYYFARLNYDPMPEMPGFAATNTTPYIIQGVGSSQQIAGYAQMAIENGNTNTFGYLGQYFDHAYAIDTNGNVTANTTGILSPAGNFFSTAPGAAALVTMADIDMGQRGTCTVYSVSLQLDANHDGNMDLNYNGTDATSPSKPFVFWANNNYDRFTLDADDNQFYDDDVQVQDSPGTPNVNTPDCNFLDGSGHRAISCERDLQDFSRLWICGVTSNLLASLPAGSTITLNWGDVGYPNSGNPTIDLFTAADGDGGIGYLTNSATADAQAATVSSPYIQRLAPGGSIQLNASSFANNWAGNHFIWCGVSNGTGGLNLTIADASGNVLAQSTVYIQIVDIKQMYERWTVGDMPNIAPTNIASLASEGLPVGIPAFQYTQPTDTNTPYILYVHGWNMEIWEKDRFAESAFKRLFWQGYQGRFGAFQWPTYNGFTGSFWQTLTDARNFDNSELIAWQSGTGLMNTLTNLNTKYPGHVYVLAHSMGNIVTGEALRLAGNNQIANTYIGSQAALPAHDYDSTVTTPYLLQFTYTYPSGLLSYAGSINYGPDTPNIYGNLLVTNAAAVGRRINFYNTNDFALAAPRWCFDQITKPDYIPPNNFYYYGGSLSDPTPWNKFYDSPIAGGAGVLVDIVTNLNNHYKIMAYAAEPRSTALGATPSVGNLTGNLNLTTVWPTDISGHNYADHFWHSAEFRGDYWQERNYWNTLLFSSLYGFNISNP